MKIKIPQLRHPLRTKCALDKHFLYFYVNIQHFYSAYDEIYISRFLRIQIKKQHRNTDLKKFQQFTEKLFYFIYLKLWLQINTLFDNYAYS